MEKNFPNAQDAHMQLLYDRHDYLYASDSQLAEKTQVLLSELIASRPKSNATALEHLQYQYKGLRLQTLLGLVDPHGVFRAKVPYELELRDELAAKKYCCVHATEDDNLMEVLTLLV